MSQLASADFWTFVGVVAGIYTIFALGLQVQFGFAGLLNFGHAAFMAIGAYTMAILVVKEHWDVWWAALAAMGAAIAAGILVGLPTVRLRADYFAIVTIAFSEIVRYVATNEDVLTGGSQGTINLAGEGQAAYYNTTWDHVTTRVDAWLHSSNRDLADLVIVWAVAFVLLTLAWRALRTPWGRVLRSIREDEDASRALGKPVFSFKLQALALGALLAGIAGLFYAFQFSYFSPSDFDPLTTFFAWTIVILGGTGRVWAVPLGSIVFGVIFAGTRFFDFAPFRYFDSADRAYLRLIVVGLVLIGLMAFRPQGLAGNKREMVLE